MNSSEQGFGISNVDAAAEAKEIAEAYAVPAGHNLDPNASIDPRLSEMAVRSSQNLNKSVAYQERSTENLSEQAAKYVSTIAKKIGDLRSKCQSGP